MKKIYEAPTVEVINLTAKGYICAGEDVFFGGSGHVQNQSGNDGGDEAKRGHFELDLANYEPWEDWKEY